MVQQSSLTLSSLYSSGQCLLSVLGSIGVILLFAGIPQLIYAPHINPGSLMTFLLGALLITLMVGGNAFIGYKYRMLVRRRREESNAQASRPTSVEDKPPSYDDLLMEEGSPPEYATLAKEKPPRYEELLTEVFNWRSTEKVSDVYKPRFFSSFSLVTSPSAPNVLTRARAPELTRTSSHEPSSSRVPSHRPVIVPLHRNWSGTLNRPQQEEFYHPDASADNPAFEASTVDLRTAAASPKNIQTSPDITGEASQTGSSNKFTFGSQNNKNFNTSSAVRLPSIASLPSLHVINERAESNVSTKHESLSQDDDESVSISHL